MRHAAERRGALRALGPRPSPTQEEGGAVAAGKGSEEDGLVSVI